MFLELHILQNFAPSNLNRDDTGAPKDCEFGGYRRARISSQCLKRAIRTAFPEALLPTANRAVRTKRLVERMEGLLVGRQRPSTETRAVVETALKGMGFGLTPEGKTEYLLFLGNAEIERLAAVCDDHWDVLAEVAAASGAQAARGANRDAKKAARAGMPAEVKKDLESVLDGGLAVDLAMFGRMLADRPEMNVDAAAQVAHAISTNRVSMEFDFYTAVDDLKPEDTAGADMLGTVEFNSACFYRYANLDLGQLLANLAGHEDLARQAVEAYVRAAIAAVPTGKQNSSAAHNPPSFVLAVLRTDALWNLANAFVRPVRPDMGAGDLVERSIAALDAYWGRLSKVYGQAGVVGKWCLTLEDTELANLGPALVTDGEALVAGVAESVRFPERKAGLA